MFTVTAKPAELARMVKPAVDLIGQAHHNIRVRNGRTSNITAGQDGYGGDARIVGHNGEQNGMSTKSR